MVKNYVSILKQYDYVDGQTTFLNAEKGITFEIFYPNGDKFDEITTDKNGYAISEKLPLGKYIVKEVQTDDEYVLDETEYHIELTEVDNLTPIVYDSLEMTNILKKGKI